MEDMGILYDAANLSTLISITTEEEDRAPPPPPSQIRFS